MFITALFTSAKIQEQPKCPSVDDWMKESRYLHNRMLLDCKERIKSCHLGQHGWT